MIGIIFGLLNFGGRVVDSAHKAVQNHDGYMRALKRKRDGTDNTNTYFDWQGTRRDLKTHEFRSVDLAVVESYGEDRCIRDIYGNVIKNLSEEDRQQRLAQAKVDPLKTVALHRAIGNGTSTGQVIRKYGGDGYCEGPQYKDLETGEIYVARCFEGVVVYMDLTGRLIRESDRTKRDRRSGKHLPYTESEINKFIEEYNKTRVKKSDLGIPDYQNPLYIHKLNKLYMNKKAIRGE